jgi:hypothetical protein
MNFLYIVAAILFTLWAIGFFAFGAGPIIHVLPGIAITSILLRNFQGDRTHK